MCCRGCNVAVYCHLMVRQAPRFVVHVAGCLQCEAPRRFTNNVGRHNWPSWASGLKNTESRNFIFLFLTSLLDGTREVTNITKWWRCDCFGGFDDLRGRNLWRLWSSNMSWTCRWICNKVPRHVGHDKRLWLGSLWPCRFSNAWLLMMLSHKNASSGGSFGSKLSRCVPSVRRP